MNLNQKIFLHIICVAMLALLIVGCASKPPVSDEKAPGLVTETTGNIQVEMPGDGEEAVTAVKPYTEEEKATYLKIQAEFNCDAMINEPENQQSLGDISEKYGMTENRVNEIENQLDRTTSYKELGEAVAKLCPEALAPSID